jgi:hypothetical protein
VHLFAVPLTIWSDFLLAVLLVVICSEEHLNACGQVCVPTLSLIVHNSHLIASALYMRIMDNFGHFAEVVQNCMIQAMDEHSFKDPLNINFKEPLGSQVIASLADVLFELVIASPVYISDMNLIHRCLTRFKNAVATQAKLAPLVRHLQKWMKIWEQGILSEPSAFDDPLKDASKAARDHIITHLNGKIQRLLAIVDREENKLDRSLNQNRFALPRQTGPGSNDGIVAALQNVYEVEGPGELRANGPRHDNDFVDIQQIRIAPTHGELTSRFVPFLPANLHNAPHPYPSQSMERLLDIQFRLLREELTCVCFIRSCG